VRSSPWILTDISTLPSTGCLGFSDLYLGNQSGENRNVGRKINQGNILVSFKIFHLKNCGHIGTMCFFLFYKKEGKKLPNVS
jgi:hypothetical protein